LANLDVLVVDDLFIAPLTNTDQRDLLEVLDDRYDRCSTVVTSQVPTKTWHEMQADPTIADAICDRLVHNAHMLSLKGPSIRKKKGLEGKIKEEKKEGDEG
jgi:DNA replication protein DnaC